ncbi:hypothetical protein [Chondrinema litorale]|uniref:hypothetical protein n=1 Tax=Chondrinema litorale TaxID=2994555 RepID=UPI0025437059|nr:hypothetical protein [Chondrinema litorale]UZR96304.1 hypothetical protein OQ292_21845 [Chondrinema litorale]
MGLIINWIAIILSPVFNYLMFQVLKEKPKAQKVTLGISGFVVLIFLLGQLMCIVCTMRIINEIILAVFYLSCCHLFWQVKRIKGKLIRYLFMVTGLIPMLLGLLLGTIGVIGFGLGYEQLWSDRQYKISNNLRLEIGSLSNSLEPGGIKVDIYHKYSLLPLQQKIISKTFDDFYIDLSSVSYIYNEASQEIKIWTEGDRSKKHLNEVIKIKGS